MHPKSPHLDPSLDLQRSGAPFTDGPRKPLRAAGYVRVSTDAQAQGGLSLGTQENTIRRYADLYGHHIVSIYQDQQSAKNAKRPGYQRMLADVVAGKIDLIICSKLDRFSRNPRDFHEFFDTFVMTRQVDIALVLDWINTSHPMARMFLPQLVAYAQLERLLTAERVKETIAFIREQGGHYGKVPFGYRTIPDGKIRRLVPDEKEQVRMAEMKTLYRASVPFDEIANHLNDSLVTTKYGHRWTKHSVYDVLVRAGVHRVRSSQSTATYDRKRAYALALASRASGMTYQAVADALNTAGLRPKNAARYALHSAMELLRSGVYHDRNTPAGYARFLRSQGKSLRAIAHALPAAGFPTKRGGPWYAHTVRMLLLS